MKLDEIRSAMLSERLKLRPVDAVRHYVWAMITGPVVAFIGHFFVNAIKPEIALFAIPIPLFLSAVWLVYLERQLRLISIETPLSRKVALVVVERVARHENWRKIKKTARLYILQTREFDLVTVIADGGKVYCSSRSGADTPNGSAGIFRNERNVAKVIGQIERAAFDPNLVADGKPGRRD